MKQLLYLTVLLFSSYFSSFAQQCNADFSFHYPQCDLKFQNLSKPSVNVKYQWDLGDGNISSLKTPQHEYEISDIYKVCLIIVDTSVSKCKDTNVNCKMVDCTHKVDRHLNLIIIFTSRK